MDDSQVRDVATVLYGAGEQGCDRPGRRAEVGPRLGGPLSRTETYTTQVASDAPGSRARHRPTRGNPRPAAGVGPKLGWAEFFPVSKVSNNKNPSPAGLSVSLSAAKRIIESVPCQVLSELRFPHFSTSLAGQFSALVSRSPAFGGG